MNPKDTLTSLFKAIEDKNLKSLQKFLPVTGPLAVILSDGTVIDDAEDFLEFFDDWFSEEDWSITNKLVFIEESVEMAFGVFACEYSGQDEDGKAYTADILTSCIVRKVDGKWLLVHFHQTEGVDEDDTV